MTAMLIRSTILSTIVFIFTTLSVAAHEVRPAIADVSVSEETVSIEVKLTAESLLAGINAAELTDTDEAPEAAQYDALRALEPVELETRFKDAWPDLSQDFLTLAGGVPVALTLDEVTTAKEDDLALPRDTTVRLTGALPGDGSDLRFGWAAENGPIIVRQSGGDEDAYADYLQDGQLSEPLPRTGTASQSALSVFVKYIGVGFDHIIPKGLDHILFVLGLFFLSLKVRPLVTQITVFTIAHTITLALASLGYISLPASIVEPLIALSIVFVAVENILVTRVMPWRPVVIFLFGLLHGLGFASVLDEFGLSSSQFAAGLIGFNIGVEIGQLTVIALAFLAVGLWFGKKEWYRRCIAIPASVAIAIMGAYWAIERTLL